MSDELDVAQLSYAILADQDGYVLVFRAYLDESGVHEGADVLSVAGYFARPKSWKAFTREWQRVLKPAGISCFHATDCQALEGEFKGWSGPDRDELVKKLLPIIPRHAVGITRVIVLKDLREALGEDDLSDVLNDPYQLCFQLLLQEALRQIRRNNSREKIAIFHERNDYQGLALRSFDFLRENYDPNDNLMSLTFGGAEKYVPLQAADILAYESAKRVLNKHGKQRRSYQVLINGQEGVDIGLFDRDNMAKFVRHFQDFRAFRAAAQQRSPASPE